MTKVAKYLCKYCNGLGQHYRLGKIKTCFACKGHGIDVELDIINLKYYPHNRIPNISSEEGQLT